MSGTESQALLRFKREFRAISTLRHPHLVRLFELQRVGERWFYTMELIRGQDIRQRLHLQEAGKAPELRGQGTEGWGDTVDASDASLPSRPSRSLSCDPQRLRGVLGQVLDALEFLHDRGMIHRDLKPENILLDEEGQCRILDFGIVKDSREAQHTGSTHGVLGTLAYMAPEQATPQPITAAADLYALGCIAFELLVGRPPFVGSSVEVLMAHQTTSAPALSEFVDDAPAMFARFCQRLLAKRPEERPGIPELRGLLGLEAPPQERDKPGLFVGRQEEYEALEHHWRRCLEGEPSSQLVLVIGESGVGKSALVEAFAQAQRQTPILLLRGRCYEREMVTYKAFDPLIDALALILRTWPADEVKALEQPLVGLSALFDSAALPFESHGWVLGQVPDVYRPQERRMLGFHALLELLRELQRKQPILVVMDDLQWADEESLSLLTFLLGSRMGRMMCIATMRPAPPEHPLWEAYEALKRADFARCLALSPFGEEGSQALLEATLGEVAPQLARQVHQQSDGNPFFILQLARYLSRRELQPGTLPSLNALFGDELKALSDDAKAIVEAAAVAGGSFSRGLLSRVTGLDNETFAAAFERLLEGHFLSPISGLEQGSYDFSHDKIREYIYAHLAPEQRRELHQSFAEALVGERARADQLLEHRRQIDEDSSVVELVLRAAEEAAKKCAFSHAAEYYEELVGQDREGHLWRRLGELRYAAGDLEGTLAAYAQALPLLQDPNDRLETQNHMARCYASQGRYPEHHQLQSALLDAIGLRLRPTFGLFTLLTLLGLALRWALQWSFPAWTRRPTRREDEVRLKIFRSICEVYQGGWPLIAAEYNLRILLLSTQDKEQAFRTKLIRIGVLLDQGISRPEKEQEIIHESLPLAQEVAFGAGYVEAMCGMAQLNVDLDQALEHFRRGLREFDRLGGQEHQDRMLIQALARSVHILQDHQDPELLEEARGDLEGDVQLELLLPAFYMLAQHHTKRSQHAEAAAYIQGWQDKIRPWQRLSPAIDGSTHSLWMNHARTQWHLLQGQYRQALQELEPFEPLYKSHGIFLSPRNQCIWKLSWCNGALGLLLHRGGLAAGLLRKLKRYSRDLSRSRIHYYPSLGQRNLAMIAMHEGDASQAQEQISRALYHRSLEQVPFYRWSVLQVAAALDALLAPQRDALQKLSDTYGFAPHATAFIDH